MIPEERRLRAGSYDLYEAEDPDEDVFIEKLHSSLTRRKNHVDSLDRLDRYEKEDKAKGFRAQQDERYSTLSSGGLSHARAYLAAYGKTDRYASHVR